LLKALFSFVLRYIGTFAWVRYECFYRFAGKGMQLRRCFFLTKLVSSPEIPRKE